jgi:hypothetical protein
VLYNEWSYPFVAKFRRLSIPRSVPATGTSTTLLSDCQSFFLTVQRMEV